MKKGNTLLTKFAAIALGAVLTVGVGATLSTVSPSREVEAATVDTKRIWFHTDYANDDWWDNGSTTRIHYWGGTGVTGTDWPGVAMSSDAANGLWFYDVPNNTENVKFVRTDPANSSTVWNKTIDVAVPTDCNSKRFELWNDDVWFENPPGTWYSEKNGAYVSFSLDTTTIVQNFADSLDTYAEACSEAKAQTAVDTYNGLSSFEQNQFDAYTYSGYSGQQGTDLNGKTGLQVLNYLRARYNIQTELNSVNSNIIFSENGKIGLIVSISIVGLTSLSGLYLLNRKRRPAQF